MTFFYLLIYIYPLTLNTTQHKMHELLEMCKSISLLCSLPLVHSLRCMGMVHKQKPKSFRFNHHNHCIGFHCVGELNTFEDTQLGLCLKEQLIRFDVTKSSKAVLKECSCSLILMEEQTLSFKAGRGQCLQSPWASHAFLLPLRESWSIPALQDSESEWTTREGKHSSQKADCANFQIFS